MNVALVKEIGMFVLLLATMIVSAIPLHDEAEFKKRLIAIAEAKTCP